MQKCFWNKIYELATSLKFYNETFKPYCVSATHMYPTENKVWKMLPAQDWILTAGRIHINRDVVKFRKFVVQLGQLPTTTGGPDQIQVAQNKQS